MTRSRMYGADQPLLAWCRRHKMLPSYSIDFGLAVADVDLTLHRFMTAHDRGGDRLVQAIMEIETKTRGGRCTDSQKDTYAKKHHGRKPAFTFRGQTIFHFGVSILRMSGLSPDDSEWMTWGRFGKGTDVIHERPISVDQLVLLLRFDLHPDTMGASPFRRHHSKRTVTMTIKTPLGFCVEREHTVRS